MADDTDKREARRAEREQRLAHMSAEDRAAFEARQAERKAARQAERVAERKAARKAEHKAE